MSTSDLVIIGFCSVMVSLIVWNLWGVYYLQREWQRVFPKEERPTIKELLDDADNDKP